MSILDFFRRKETITGSDINGNLFDIKIRKGEEISEEAFIELSNGTGEAEGYE